MTSTDGDSRRIGPELSLGDVDLPAAVGERVRTLYGADSVPETGDEWIALVRDAVADVEGRPPTVDDLCTAAAGAHAFTNGSQRQSYVCVLDPIAYAFVTGTAGTVESETPVREERVTFHVGGDGLDVSHADAVVSLGVSDDVEDVEPALERTYRQACRYVRTFAAEDEYETWAADVDAATTALSAREGVAVGRELAGALFGRAHRPTRP